MLPQRKYFYLLFLFLSFSFIKLDENVQLTDGHFSKYYTSKEGLLNFNVKKIKNFPYVKIVAEGQYKNHIISYYENNKYKERKQLSQSLKNTTIMWLAGKQIQNDFYITIECPKFPCEFNLTLNGTNTAELKFNEQYTYYITEENKKMNFTLLNSDTKYIDSNYFSSYYLSIWAKGNNKIETDLSGGKISSNPYNNYYNIKYEDFIESTCSLIINGKIGDLITVGFILFRAGADGTSVSELILENGEEVSGYIEPFEGHLYKSINESKLSLGYYYDLDNKMINPNFILMDYYCMQSTEKENELFYTLQYINDTKYDGYGNNKYYPFINGIYHIKRIIQGTTIGLIPMKPDNDFSYLTYEVFPISGNISVSIYNCENYPLCHIDEQIIEKSENIKDFQSFYYTYYKKEWDNDITPISKKQNMLLITCKDGYSNSTRSKKICVFNINMKTDKNYVKNTDFTHVFPPYKRYIRKDNKDKYLFEGKNHPIYLYIEIFTGKINIEIDPKDCFQKNEKGNKILYKIPEKTDIKITIVAKENSVYSINVKYYIKNEKLTIGLNYLLNIENNDEISLLPSVNIDNLKIIEKKNMYNYLIKITPFNCNINIKIIQPKYITYKNIIKKGEIYQDVIQTSSSINKFNVTKNSSDKNSWDSCLFLVSTYKLEEFSSKSQGISLGYNDSQVFSFNSNRNSLIFSFPYTEKENDIKINFQLLTEVNYIIEIMANEENLLKEKINSTKEIQLNSIEINKNCKDFKYICKILLFVQSENKWKESKLEITLKIINKDAGNNDHNDDDDDATKLIIILCISGVVIFGIIAVIAYYYIKSYYKNIKLSHAVQEISFKESNKKDGNEEDGDFDGNALLD